MPFNQITKDEVSKLYFSKPFKDCNLIDKSGKTFLKDYNGFPDTLFTNYYEVKFFGQKVSVHHTRYQKFSTHYGKTPERDSVTLILVDKTTPQNRYDVNGNLCEGDYYAEIYVTFHSHYNMRKMKGNPVITTDHLNEVLEVIGSRVLNDECESGIKYSKNHSLFDLVAWKDNILKIRKWYNQIIK